MQRVEVIYHRRLDRVEELVHFLQFLDHDGYGTLPSGTVGFVRRKATYLDMLPEDLDIPREGTEELTVGCGVTYSIPLNYARNVEDLARLFASEIGYEQSVDANGTATASLEIDPEKIDPDDLVAHLENRTFFELVQRLKPFKL